MVPNLFGTSDRFRERQFFHGKGVGVGAARAQCTIGVAVSGEPNAVAGVTGGGAQAPVRTRGDDCKY